MHQEETREKEAASVFDYWNTYLKNCMDGMATFSGSAGKNGTGRKNEDKESKAGEIPPLFPGFGDSKYMGKMFKEMNKLPQMTMDMGQKAWEYYSDAQRTGLDWYNYNGRIQELVFSEDDRNIMDLFGKIYETEVKKFLEVPQLGLNRFKQERVNRFVDRFNLYQKTLAEFLHISYVPMEKAACVLRKKMEEMFESGETIEDFKDFHALWIRILEEQYMAQLESSEYTEGLNRMLDATVQFRSAKEEVLYDFLQNLPIPTNRDMDELYKEIYTLKKKLRKVSAAFENLQKTHTKEQE